MPICVTSNSLKKYFLLRNNLQKELWFHSRTQACWLLRALTFDDYFKKNMYERRIWNCTFPCFDAVVYHACVAKRLERDRWQTNYIRLRSHLKEPDEDLHFLDEKSKRERIFARVLRSNARFMLNVPDDRIVVNDGIDRASPNRTVQLWMHPILK